MTDKSETLRVVADQGSLARLHSRRSFLHRSGAGAAALMSMPALLAACGGDDGDTSGGGGNIRMINYADWIGANEIKRFTAKTGVKVQQIVINSDENRIAKVSQDPGSTDMMLLEATGAGRVKDLGLLADVDLGKIPNYKLVPKSAKFGPFAEDAPNGIASDYGRVSFVYREDMVAEQPTTWAEVFELAPKYSGKIVFIDIENDALGATLIGQGYDPNSVDPDELKDAGDALIDIKPHLKSLVTADMLKPLLDGSAAIGMTWDFDAQLVIADNPDVPLRWVDAEDGMRAYLDGWLALKDTKVLDQVHEFMNNHLSPRVYADFVNTLGISILVREAEPYVKQEIAKSKILFPSSAVQERITFGRPHGEGQRQWDDAWNRFKAA